MISTNNYSTYPQKKKTLLNSNQQIASFNMVEPPLFVRLFQHSNDIIYYSSFATTIVRILLVLPSRAHA